MEAAWSMALGATGLGSALEHGDGQALAVKVLMIALAVWAGAKAFVWLAQCPEVYGRHTYKQGRFEAGTFKRRKLDRLRAREGNFPRPYPNGWYRIADSADVRKGEVLTESALGRELVVFRGEDGKVGVVDAFCPHLGTHLGHGGTVQGNNLVCPYHLWEFDADGCNKNIPYCNKDMSHSKRVNLKAYHSLESKGLGTIFFWYHADGIGAEPQWELHPDLLEMEADVGNGTMRRVCDTRWDDMLMHITEASCNSADTFHFSTVHKYLPMPYNLKLIKADHIIKCVYGQDGTEIPRDCLLIREKLASLRLFGWDALQLPAFVANSFVTYVHIQGPSNVVFRVDTVFGRFRGHYSMLPLEPFRQKATMAFYADKSIPAFLVKLLHWAVEETVGQDRQVWEHKSNVAPRNLVAGDGPFVQYGKWLEHFYTEKSTTWKEICSAQSLDW